METMNYTIQLGCNHSVGEFCLMIIDNETGKYLTYEQYDEWVRYIGGTEKR